MGYEKKRKRKASMIQGPSNDFDERWQIEEDLRSVARADAVNADPERMKKVRALAKEKLDESKRKKDEAQKLIDLAQTK